MTRMSVDSYRRKGAMWLQAMAFLMSFVPVLSQPGFLSIDCGSEKNYTDPATGIEWVTDAGYISTGKNAQNIMDLSSNTSSSMQVESLRYFDDGRSKNCYVLPVKAGVPYLVRATFFYGNWTPITNLVWFDVYINSTVVSTLGYLPGGYEIGKSTSPINALNSWEAIVYSTGSELNICLAKKLLTTAPPFISSLELRELAPNMYNVTTSNKLLRTYIRWNCGVALNDTSPIRYPDDAYDRLWNNPTWAAGTAYVTANDSISSWNTSTPNHAPDRPPVKVMEDAWITNGYSTATLAGDNDFYATAYFQEVDKSVIDSKKVRGVNYYLNDVWIASFNTSDRPLEVLAPIQHISVDNIRMVLETRNGSGSALSPILNAVEVLYVYNMSTAMTNNEDAIALAIIKRQFNLTDWMGDPCVPFPHDWLLCNTDTPARIIQMNLQSRGPAFPSMISQEISNLTMLTYLDIANNSLKGNLGDLVMNTPNLQELNAADNLFEGEFPSSQFFSHQNLSIVNLDRNHYNGSLDLSLWYSTGSSGTTSKLTMLSLINNSITEIFPHLDIISQMIEQSINTSTPVNTILLGGNPWCEDTKENSQAHQYLCRFTVNDLLIGESGGGTNDKTLIMAIAIPVGLFTILLSCICFASLWKLRKQLHTINEIQEALAKQKVQPPFYSYTDLRSATMDFSVDRTLGKGAFGSVSMGVLVDGTVVAVKKLFHSEQALTEFLNEVVLITGIKHKNLVQLKGCCIKDKQRMLVYEFAENGNLDEALRGGTKLDWQQRHSICVGVARGLAYLHEELQPRIIHRDIKPANILLDKNFNAKIGDFGLARPFLEEQSQAAHTQLAGTLGYLAPEYATQGQLTEKADVFSFGVLLLEIVSGRRCIDHKLPHEQVFLQPWARKLHHEGKVLDILDPCIRESSKQEDVARVVNVALLCLQMDPTRRPRMSHVVTMLVGNMDVTVFLDKSIPSQPSYDTLNPSLKDVALNVVSEETCLLDNEFPETNGISNASSSRPELNGVSPR